MMTAKSSFRTCSSASAALLARTRRTPSGSRVASKARRFSGRSSTRSTLGGRTCSCGGRSDRVGGCNGERGYVGSDAADRTRVRPGREGGQRALGSELVSWLVSELGGELVH